jgi:hypothetical protein
MKVPARLALETKDIICAEAAVCLSGEWSKRKEEDP